MYRFDEITSAFEFGLGESITTAFWADRHGRGCSLGRETNAGCWPLHLAYTYVLCQRAFCIRAVATSARSPSSARSLSLFLRGVCPSLYSSSLPRWFRVPLTRERPTYTLDISQTCAESWKESLNSEKKTERWGAERKKNNAANKSVSLLPRRIETEWRIDGPSPRLLNISPLVFFYQQLRHSTKRLFIHPPLYLSSPPPFFYLITILILFFISILHEKCTVDTNI